MLCTSGRHATLDTKFNYLDNRFASIVLFITLEEYSRVNFESFSLKLQFQFLTDQPIPMKILFS